MKWVKRLGLGATLLVLLTVLSVLGVGCALHRAKPDGKAGPEADALARKMLDAVHDDAWKNIGAVRWEFPGGHKHLWDRTRGLARVTWSNHEVLVRLSNKTGVAYTDGKQVKGDAGQALVTRAWSMWANDSFWLNPVTKAFDEGTTRKLVDVEDGTKGVLVSYASGGDTPGDAYLWLLGKDGRPRAWRMWVKIIPVGGLEFAWKDWQTLPGGALVAAGHDGVIDINLKDIKAALTLQELVPGKDPFARLLEGTP